jgi:hypothetical protein
VLVAWGFRQDLPFAIPSWPTTTGGVRTAAGWWYGFVAIPVFQFLFLRWRARMLIWWYLRWRIGQLDLHLAPTHPDYAGGLGVFGVALDGADPDHVQLHGHSRRDLGRSDAVRRRAGGDLRSSIR